MSKIVYTTESGTEYTYADVLKIAKGNKEYADLLIERATWQHIETLVDEDYREGEIIEIDGAYVLTHSKTQNVFYIIDYPNHGVRHLYMVLANDIVEAAKLFDKAGLDASSVFEKELSYKPIRL